MKISGVQLEGRLGNQIFQYVLAICLAKKKGGLFFVNQIRWHFFLPKYFKLPSYNKTLNSILSKMYQFAHPLFSVLDEKGSKENIPGFSYHMGYFQDEAFFAGYKELITREVELKDEVKASFYEKYGKLYKDNKIIAVHIRRTDLLTLNADKGAPVNATLSEKYYQNCFESIRNIESYKIVFASDDMAYVQQKYGHLPNAIIEEKSEIMDFAAIQNADIIISASSSFSWMAAYLNNKPDKIVFTPANWGIIFRIMPPQSEITKWHVVEP